MVIDTVTNLVELVRINDKKSDETLRKYAQCWLAQYLWPQQCVHDPGGEFAGIEFQTSLEKYHIIQMLALAQKNAIQCNMRKDASNSWKCPKNIITW